MMMKSRKAGKGYTCPDCDKFIEGMDCAHTLSRLEGWKNKSGCCALCLCGYPVNAKQVWANVFNNYLDDKRDSSENAYIYAETKGGQGHVYYGTFNDCVRGNGLSASGMSTCKVFKRYGGAN